MHPRHDGAVRARMGEGLVNSALSCGAPDEKDSEFLFGAPDEKGEAPNEKPA